MQTLMHWIGPTFDVLAIVLLAAVLWRLGRDPVVVWQERETRLQGIFDELRALVAQSEGLARDLDAKLAGREERLRELVASAEAVTTRGEAPGGERMDVRAVERSAARGETADPGMTPRQNAVVASDVTVRQIERLGAAGTPIEEIARQVGVASAEVRLVIGLKAARAARQRARAGEAGADAR